LADDRTDIPGAMISRTTAGPNPAETSGIADGLSRVLRVIGVRALIGSASPGGMSWCDFSLVAGQATA
jgi:hypothetical protein